MIALPFIHRVEPRSFGFERITLKQLQELLTASKGAKIVTFVAVTDPVMKNSVLINNVEYENPYLNLCVKVSRVNGIVNWHYANAVNNQLKREGKETDFIPQPRKWGTRLDNSPFVAHVLKDGTNRLYLEVKVEKSIDNVYYDATTGMIVPIEEIELWIIKKKPNPVTEKEIILRDYLVNNIATIVIDGNGYLIEENIA